MKPRTADKIEHKEFEYLVERKYRNYKYVLYMFIAGLGLMYLILTLMYVLYRFEYHLPSVRLTAMFIFNNMVLLLSIATLYLTQHFFSTSNYYQYKTCLLMVSFLGLLFLVGQIIAVIKQLNLDVVNGYYTSYYLFLISIVHALQVFMSLLFWSIFSWKSWKQLSNYAISIVYFTDPVMRLQLNLFSIFWYSSGLFWMIVYVFFLAYAV